MKFVVDVTLKPGADSDAFLDTFLNWLCNNPYTEDLIAVQSFDGVEKAERERREQREDR